MDPLDIVIYKAMSGESFQVHDCHSVKQMLIQLREQTDWLWGVGFSYSVVDMHSNEPVPASSASLIRGGKRCFQIVYALRISSLGFPCFQCCSFVPWEGHWFTRYHRFDIKEPGTNTRRNRRALYAPRDYFCADCGSLLEGGRQRRHLEEVMFHEGRYYVKTLEPDVGLCDLMY